MSAKTTNPERCPECGHVRYHNDLFDGECAVCCDWIIAQLADRDRRLAEARDVALRPIPYRGDPGSTRVKESILNHLINRLDRIAALADAPETDETKRGISSILHALADATETQEDKP